MASAIVPRSVISAQAEAAARIFAADQPKPPNPYCAYFTPEHHAEWEASFTRSLHSIQACEGCETSA